MFLMFVNHHSKQEQFQRVVALVLKNEWASLRVVMMEHNFVTSVVANNFSQVLQVNNYVVKCVAITGYVFIELLAIISNDIVI